jgi:hypothetical protein
MVMDMDEEEVRHLRQLRAAYLRNLRELELQEANYSLEVPIHIKNGIKDFEEKIRRLDFQISQANASSNSTKHTFQPKPARSRDISQKKPIQVSRNPYKVIESTVDNLSSRRRSIYLLLAFIVIGALSYASSEPLITDAGTLIGHILIGGFFGFLGWFTVILIIGCVYGAWLWILYLFGFPKE